MPSKKTTTVSEPTPRRQLTVDLTPALYSALRIRAASETATSGQFVSLSSIVARALKAWMLGAVREGDAS
jgi:hypothetical protein